MPPLTRSWIPFWLAFAPLGLLLAPFWPPKIFKKIAKLQKITKKTQQKLLLNASWAHFGCSCVQLGSSWPLLGAIWENFARSWAQLGTPNGLPSLILLPAVCSLLPAASFLQNVCLLPAVYSPLPAACSPVAWQSLGKNCKIQAKTKAFILSNPTA